MRGAGGVAELGLQEALSYEGPCRIPGALFDLGEYPGLVEGAGVVIGELHTIRDEKALEALDEFEGEGSLYVRKRVRLIEPAVEAWVYVYNDSLAGAKPIASGCWRTHAGLAEE